MEAGNCADTATADTASMTYSAQTATSGQLMPLNLSDPILWILLVLLVTLFVCSLSVSATFIYMDKYHSRLTKKHVQLLDLLVCEYMCFLNMKVGENISENKYFPRMTCSSINNDHIHKVATPGTKEGLFKFSQQKSEDAEWNLEDDVINKCKANAKTDQNIQVDSNESKSDQNIQVDFDSEADQNIPVDVESNENETSEESAYISIHPPVISASVTPEDVNAEESHVNPTTSQTIENSEPSEPEMLNSQESSGYGSGLDQSVGERNVTCDGPPSMRPSCEEYPVFGKGNTGYRRNAGVDHLGMDGGLCPKEVSLSRTDESGDISYIENDAHPRPFYLSGSTYGRVSSITSVEKVRPELDKTVSEVNPAQKKHHTTDAKECGDVASSESAREEWTRHEHNTDHTHAKLRGDCVADEHTCTNIERISCTLVSLECDVTEDLDFHEDDDSHFDIQRRNELSDEDEVLSSLSLRLNTDSIRQVDIAPADDSMTSQDGTDGEHDWQCVMQLYDVINGHLHRFPWVVGCMVSSDVLEVVVNLSGTTLATDAAYDRLCDVIPQNLRQYLIFSEDAPSVNLL